MRLIDLQRYYRGYYRVDGDTPADMAIIGSGGRIVAATGRHLALVTTSPAVVDAVGRLRFCRALGEPDERVAIFPSEYFSEIAEIVGIPRPRRRRKHRDFAGS